MAGESAASRDELARQAEKHLRQGRTDLALELYERLAQFAPTDWNAVKQLADLLERAGHREAAAGRFLECADHHFAEGFHARAAALYRKVLKLEPLSEHALCQLAEVSLALKLKADARVAFGQVLSLRQRRGDVAGVADITRRLAELDDVTPATATSAAPAPAAPAPADSQPPVAPSPEQVTRRLREVAAEADARGDVDGASRAWLAVLHREPADRLLRNRLVGAAVDRQDFDAARPLLAWYADNDPEGLAWRFEAAQRDGRSDVAQAIAERVSGGGESAADSSAALTIAHAVRDVLRTRHATLADGWCSRIIDALAEDGRHTDAVGFIEAATARHPLPVECHLRWVELCVDGGLEGLDRAQYALASAYLHGGQAELARAVADDLLVRQPDVDHIRELVLTIHQACGEPDPERSVQHLLTPSLLEMPAAPMWTAEAEPPVVEAWPVDDPSVDPPVLCTPSVVQPSAVAAPALVTQAEPVLPAFAAFDWGALLGRQPDVVQVAPGLAAAAPLPVAVPPPAADLTPPTEAPADVAPLHVTPPDVAPPSVASPEAASGPVSLDIADTASAAPAEAPDVPTDLEFADESWTLVAESASDPDEVDLTELLEQLQPLPMPSVPQSSPPTLVPPSPSSVPTPALPPPPAETDLSPREVGPPLPNVVGDEALSVDEPPGMLAAQQVAAGRVFAAAGLAAEAARAFARASRDARSRFEAAEALAGLHRSRGQLAEAIRWYDEAAHAPVPDAADRRPVLYDLAETLEAAGQPDRALAVLLDLLSEVEDYRDARARADRLLRVDAGG